MYVNPDEINVCIPKILISILYIWYWCLSLSFLYFNFVRRNETKNQCIIIIFCVFAVMGIVFCFVFRCCLDYHFFFLFCVNEWIFELGVGLFCETIFFICFDNDSVKLNCLFCCNCFWYVTCIVIKHFQYKLGIDFYTFAFLNNK